MSAERISMRKIKDVLRLKFVAQLSHRQIAAALKLSVGVVNKYLAATALANLTWPLPDGFDDAAAEVSPLRISMTKAARRLAVQRCIFS